MSRTPLVPLVLLFSVLSTAAHALQFSPASPIGQPAYPPVNLVAVSPAMPQVVYAAAGGKLFRSSDDGATWITLAAPSSSIEHLVVDPTDSAVVYIIGQKHMYRSDDSGATWKDLTPHLGTISTLSVRVDPQEPSTIYIGARCEGYPVPTGGGVLKSTDRGETWSLSLFGNCIDFLSLDPATPRHLFTNSWTGARYRTEDAARTWRKVSGELPVFDVVADPLDPSRRYGLGFGSGVAPDFQHFLISTDAGASWSKVSAEGLPHGGQQLAIDRATRRLFLAGQGVGLNVSDDLGLHWRHIDAVPVVPATSLTMATAGEVMYIATAQGLYRVPMSDPDSPTAIHLGEPAPLRLSLYRIALDPNEASTVYATALEGYGVLNLAYRVLRSTDSGKTWERITAEDDTAWRYTIAVDAVGDLYAADTHTMWRFARATQTWETWTVPELYPQILLANPQRPGWLYAANSGWAAISTDGGRTWTRIANVPGFWSLSIAPNGSDLVGGNNDGAFASSDGGVTWRALPTGRFETKSVAIAPSSPDTIYRLTNPANGMQLSALFRSDDGGVTWTMLRWPGERDSALPIAVDPRDPRSVWIGLAHSTDGGVTWTIEPSNTPMVSVMFNDDGSVLYGIARDSSLWTTTVRGIRRRAIGR